MIQNKTSKLFSLLSIIFSSIFFQSCDKDPCSNVSCTGPESYCVSGICQCPPGYEGVNCDIPSVEKYQGYYTVSESCNPGTPSGWNGTYISPGNTIEKLQFSDALGRGLPAEATVQGNYLYFPQQNIGSIQFSGQGEYIENTNRIRIEYEYYVSGTANRCIANLYKQ